MDKIFLSCVLAFAVAYFSIPAIIKVAKHKHLFDEPDERKVHKDVIPTLGGLGIFAGFILAVLMGVKFGQNPEFQFFAAAIVLMFLIGIKDDIMVISASKKFLAQLLATGIVIKFGGINLHSLHGFLGFNEIPYVASVLFTAFTIVVITNAFNLIDGVDGLAGSLGVISSIAFGTYFYLAGHLAYSVMAFSLSGAILAFLIYNFSPAKIFMGDTGSLIIGMVNSILAIKFINVAGDANSVLYLSSSPAIAFALLIVPLFDTLRVFTLRILGRRSPFSPDRTHVHHYLLDLGFSHRKIVYSCVAATIVIASMIVIIRKLDCTLVIGTAILSAVAIMGFILKARKEEKTKSLNIPESDFNDDLFKKQPLASYSNVTEYVEAD